ncbi:conserved protein of unknown function [Pseudomonas marincola]|uniref:Uncharacterized protein n=1 Tax=Pseudomonas marincola TaxID=437900 RepID=A0A653E542_9PSED|nr:hypothetical protein [Pseudomonas marincola]CAE6888751.1 conserved protein of unknown function [Pseudomonas marincola]
MILLSDNDILVKISQCDLIEELLTVFNCQVSDLYVLDFAKHSLYLKDADKCIGRRVGNHQAYDRLCGLVYGCNELGVAEENIDFLEELSVMENMDSGEQALLLHAFDLHSAGRDFYLATGDKRALYGVLNSDSAIAKDILAHRVECTESLILKIMKIYGFQSVNHKISSAIPVTDRFDSVLRMAFGPERSQEHAISCLNSYIEPIAGFMRP